MKSIQKIIRVQLKSIKQDETSLIGIVSAEPDYKLSLALNKTLKISLRNMSPFTIPDEKAGNIEFSRFSDVTHSPELAINLISNRSGNNYLLKKLRNVDYILQVVNPQKMNSTEHFGTILRDTESVTAVFIIDKDNFKEKNLQYLTQ